MPSHGLYCCVKEKENVHSLVKWINWGSVEFSTPLKYRTGCILLQSTPKIIYEKQDKLSDMKSLSLLVFYVTCHDISVIYVTAQMCRRTEEVEVVPTVGLPTPLTFGSVSVETYSRKEHGPLLHHIARFLTARRICMGHSKSSILIQYVYSYL